MDALRIPNGTVREAKPLLHQQCWSWGQDIQRPQGNLLLEAGFERIRPAEGVEGSSRYLKRYQDGRLLLLWGFGLFCGDPALGGVYLNRYRFQPQWLPLATAELPIWGPHMLPDAQQPPRPTLPLALTAIAAERMADYEEWVLGRCGLEYRMNVLAAWKRAKATIPPDEIPAGWRTISQSLKSVIAAQQEECA